MAITASLICRLSSSKLSIAFKASASCSELPCGRDRRASTSQFKQLQLFHIILSAFVFDILLNHFLVSSATHRGNILSIGPKLPAPQPLLDTGDSTEYLPRGDTLHQPHHLTSRIPREKPAQHMHMILVKTHRVHLNLIALLEPSHHLDNHLFNLLREQTPAVFHRQLKMIIALRDVMIPSA